MKNPSSIQAYDLQIRSKPFNPLRCDVCLCLLGKKLLIYLTHDFILYLDN